MPTRERVELTLLTIFCSIMLVLTLGVQAYHEVRYEREAELTKSRER